MTFISLKYRFDGAKAEEPPAW